MASNIIRVYILLIYIFQCSGISWRRQLEHIAKTRLENEGLLGPIPARRFYQFDPRELSNIIGVPSQASHLPEAEPLQPGHTLLRPAMGMLKSALKFPHRELEGGAGVYGNIDNLGLKYDSRNERLMYSGFRRFPSDYIMVIPSPSQVKYEKPRFKLESAVINMDRRAKAKNEILKILKKLNIPTLKGVKVFVATGNGNYFDKVGRTSAKDSSFYLNENSPKHYYKNAIRNLLRTKLEDNFSKIHNQNMAEVNAGIENTVEKDHRYNPSKQEEYENKKALQQNTLGTFDHIQIMQEAPELNELIPVNDETENIRKWWFYNADDYRPFSRKI